VGLHESKAVTAGPRRIAFHTAASQHGRSRRLVSPSDVGRAGSSLSCSGSRRNRADWRAALRHPPHSGIATLTVVPYGGIQLEDTTGKRGQVAAGGLEWMESRNGRSWHDGALSQALPMVSTSSGSHFAASEENSPPQSQYIRPRQCRKTDRSASSSVATGRASSPISGSEGINYFHVSLKDGEKWRYAPACRPQRRLAFP